MIARILLALAALAAVTSTTTTAQTCGGAGYDLSSIANVDLTFAQGEYVWHVRPCGIVNGNGTGACVGQVCQNTTLISVYDYSAFWYVLPSTSGTGVEQQTDNGSNDGCMDPRGARLVFQCNPTATTPFISSVTEPNTCIYNVNIQTSASCNATGDTSASTPGSNRDSAVCGGGFYDISALNAQDLTYNTAAGGTNYTLRVCGNVTNPLCSSAQPASVCQVASGYTYSLSYYSPPAHDVIYTLTTSGMRMFYQDGASCGGTPRAVNITFVCSVGAATPVFTYTNESPTCHYNFQIVTSAVCTLLSGSSSTGGGLSLSSSSSTGGGLALSSSSSTTIGGLSSVSSVGSSSSAPSADSSSSTGSSSSEGSSSSSSSADPLSSSEFIPASSSTGDVSPGTANGAMTFAPSMIALLVAVLMAAVAQL